MKKMSAQTGRGRHDDKHFTLPTAYLSLSNLR